MRKYFSLSSQVKKKIFEINFDGKEGRVRTVDKINSVCGLKELRVFFNECYFFKKEKFILKKS